MSCDCGSDPGIQISLWHMPPGKAQWGEHGVTSADVKVN
jgi:hypothetical protein